MKIIEHANDTNVRAGIIIRLKGTNKILIEHATEHPKTKPCMDIPKGHITSGEEIEVGACREVYEETGIDIDPSELTLIGTFKYQKSTLTIFYIEMDFDIGLCYCESKFKNAAGKMLPEVDEYELFDIVEDNLEESLIYTGLKPILYKVFDTIQNDLS